MNLNSSSSQGHGKEAMAKSRSAHKLKQVGANQQLAAEHFPISNTGGHKSVELLHEPELNISDELVSKVSKADVLCFDIDDTLNEGRGQAITKEAAALVFQMLSLGKKIRFISGRTYDEFKKIGTLDPLLKLMRERNLQSELVVYSAGGGEKVVIKCDGKSTPDYKYVKPYSGFISAKILDVIYKSDQELDSQQQLRNAGVATFINNYANLIYQWSPYGKTSNDEHQYHFEKKPNGGAQYSPPRLTRKQLGDAVVARLKKLGINSIEASVSGKTTVSFSRRGVNKRYAMLDVLKEGKVAYFGDEVSSGNDHIIGEMANAYKSKLTVIALDKESSNFPKGVCYVGGVVRGTIEVLRKAHYCCITNTKQLAGVKEVLANYVLGKTINISALNDGQGIHIPFHIVETEKAKYILRHVRSDLFRDPLSAARCEVLCVNTLRSNNVPVAEIIKTRRLSSAIIEDNYITIGADGNYYLLYKFIEGEVGAFPKMNPQRNEAMIKMLAKFHRVVATIDSPYSREYTAPSLLGLAAKAEQIEELYKRISAKKKSDPGYVYTRGERLVLENAEFLSQQLRLSTSNLSRVYDDLPKLLLHSDFHPPNVIFSKDKSVGANEIIGIIDLEHMRKESRIYDLTPMLRMGTEKGRFNLETAREIILSYHKENPLTFEEVIALPEICRLKLLDRARRLVDFARHHESIDFDFNGVPEEEKSLAMIDHKDSLYDWYQNLIMALRDLDIRITFGDFKREIQDRIEQPKLSAADLFKAHINRLKKEASTYEIPTRSLSTFSMDEMLRSAKEVQKVCAIDGGNWSQVGNFFYNAKSPEKAWCRLQADEKVLFYSDKVVVSQVSTGNVFVWIRGNVVPGNRSDVERGQIEIVLDSDHKVTAVHLLHAPFKLEMPLPFAENILLRKVESGGLDKSSKPKKGKIELFVDEDLNVKSVNAVPAVSAELNLSRSSIAIQLTDSGIFDLFPSFHDLLKYQLVWQNVDGALRHGEILDSYDIRLDLLNKAQSSPTSISKEELTQIANFRFFKSRAVRRKALEVLGLLYDQGSVDRKEFEKHLGFFVQQDLKEDFRVIERTVKNDPAFLRDLFKNLFARDNFSVNDLACVSIEYCDQDSSKQLYFVQFALRDGSKKRAVLTLVRHDPIDQTAGIKEDQITSSVNSWRILSVAEKSSDAIVRFGAATWERDYRVESLILGGPKGAEIREPFVNNVHISAREYLAGVSLQDILEDPGLNRRTKSAAINACRKILLPIFGTARKEFGKGVFIEKIEPRHFILTENSGKAKYLAKLTDTCRLVDYENFRDLVDEFNRVLRPA